MNSPLLGLSQRLPPTNLQAEQALLGALLANNRAYERCGDIVRAEHFADPVHAAIYAAIAGRCERNQLADALTLKAEFEHSGVLDEVGGVAYLAQLLSAMVSPLMAGPYAQAIRDCWMLRALIGLAEDTVAACFAPGEAGAAGVLEAHEARLTAIVDGVGDEAPAVALGDAVAQALAVTQAAEKRGTGLAGVTTGFAALDRMTGGLIPGELCVLAARPAMGKTSLALSIAVRAARAGAVQSLFWSGEMGPGQLAARAAAAHARLSTLSVFTARGFDPPEHAELGHARALTMAEWDALVASERAARKLPVMIDARSGLTVAALRARARRMKRAGRLDLVVVDYLGLMRGTPEAERAGLYEAMSEKALHLKHMAEELGVPVLLLAQMNRENEKRDNKRPIMSDLRDSGAIEQHADRVMFLHRPHYYLKQAGVPARGKGSEEAHSAVLSAYYAELSAAEGVAEILVQKNRHGPSGTTRLRFEAHTTWFFDLGDTAEMGGW